MPLKGFTGISFPFRIGVKGGVVTSTTSRDEITHIEESVYQLLGTKRMERWMEYHIFSELDIFVFEPNNESLHTLIDYQIRQALALEKRITVERVDIQADASYLYLDLYFMVVLYQTYYSMKLKFNKSDGSIGKGEFHPCTIQTHDWKGGERMRIPGLYSQFRC